MITILVPCTLLLLAPASDFYDEPIFLDVGGPSPCVDDSGCINPDTPHCEVETGECVECLSPEHCPEGWTCGSTGFCRDACMVEADCEGINDQTLCHPDSGLCVQCVDASDCVPAEYCTEDDGFCRVDLCEAGQTACLAGTVIECTADGGPGQLLDICPEGCEEVDGMAQCVMTSGSSGGSAGTGSDESGADGSASSTMGSDTGPDASDTGPDASGSAGTGIDADDGGKGCACRTEPPTGSAWAWSWWLVLGTGVVRRRRPTSASTCPT
jgi:MYXO-CTERM domain-containing protein